MDFETNRNKLITQQDLTDDGVIDGASLAAAGTVPADSSGATLAAVEADLNAVKEILRQIGVPSA